MVDRFLKWFDKDAQIALVIVVLATITTFTMFRLGFF